MSDAEPRVIVAVSVTDASGWPAAGRVTAPVALITAASLDAHATLEPLGATAGRVRFAATAERSPSVSAAVSRCTFVASEGCSAATSAADRAVS